MHPRKLEISVERPERSREKENERNGGVEGARTKSQGRIQGIEGSFCVHVERGPRERASESAKEEGK